MAHKKLKTHWVGILFNLQLHGSLPSPSYCAQIRTCCSWTRTTTAGPACAASRRRRRPARHSTRRVFSLSTRRTCGHRSARRPLILRAHAAAATPAFGLNSQVFVPKNVCFIILVLDPQSTLRITHCAGKFMLLDTLLAIVRTTSNERFVLISNYTQTLDLCERLCQMRKCVRLRVRVAHLVNYCIVE